jgi:receptor tyrosine kinase-like orphan receptor 1
MLDPQIIESNDDKGFCEPYRGTICTNILSANYSIYSMNANQQEQIEERIKSLLPLLTNKNSISKQCASFALPSLCMFAFPLCDSERQQPKQICRADCKQLQFDICKDEYINVKALFANKCKDFSIDAT